jgi:hypothetical protein
MVYYTDTLEVLHPLTEKGLKEYRQFLEKEADMILFKHKHPFRYMFMKIKTFFESIKIF